MTYVFSKKEFLAFLNAFFFFFFFFFATTTLMMIPSTWLCALYAFIRCTDKSPGWIVPVKQNPFVRIAPGGTVLCEQSRNRPLPHPNTHTRTFALQWKMAWEDIWSPKDWQGWTFAPPPPQLKACRTFAPKLKCIPLTFAPPPLLTFHTNNQSMTNRSLNCH